MKHKVGGIVFFVSRTKIDSIGFIHRDIMRRCYDEKYKLYKDYGAKGRRVCEEWHDRENFRLWAHNNGFEKGLRLLRRDTKADYCPDNCFWGVSPTKSYEYGKIKVQKAAVKARKDEFKALGVDVPSDHPLAEIHHGIITRCYNSNAENYHSYGGRGIKVCEEWRGKGGMYNFMRWALNDGGYHPGLTIDRIDVDGDYSPDNCRFVTMYVQAQNKRRNHIFLVNGEIMSAMAYCRYKNISYNKFMYYLNKGMNINQILDRVEK